MFEKRVWERILEITSEMLEIARKRNDLLKESAQKEREFRQKEKEYCEFTQYVTTFANLHKEIDWSSEVDSLTSPVEKKWKELKEQMQLYLEKFEEAGQLTYRLENYKKTLSSFQNIYQNLKLKKEEIPEGNTYELVILVLLANEENPNITEDDFFASKEDFYEIIRRRNDSVLKEILEKSGITENISLDLFLEKV